MKSTIEIEEKKNKNIINIKKLLNDLENIGNEKEKEEFIKNYSRINEEIKNVDNILNDNNLKNINELESKTINELFGLLENNENKIFDNEVLTIEELKSLIDICNILENKINDNTMSILEIK
jgi:hypothetical protein